MTATNNQTMSIAEEVMAKALTNAFEIIGIRTTEKYMRKKNKNSMGKRKGQVPALALESNSTSQSDKFPAKSSYTEQPYSLSNTRANSYIGTLQLAGIYHNY